MTLTPMSISSALCTTGRTTPPLKVTVVVFDRLMMSALPLVHLAVQPGDEDTHREEEEHHECGANEKNLHGKNSLLRERLWLGDARRTKTDGSVGSDELVDVVDDEGVGRFVVIDHLGSVTTATSVLGTNGDECAASRAVEHFGVTEALVDLERGSCRTADGGTPRRLLGGEEATERHGHDLDDHSGHHEGRQQHTDGGTDRELEAVGLGAQRTLQQAVVTRPPSDRNDSASGSGMAVKPRWSPKPSEPSPSRSTSRPASSSCRAATTARTQRAGR